MTTRHHHPTTPTYPNRGVLADAAHLAAQPDTTMPPPDSERIQKLAYQLWESEGRPDGRARDHWREAERQLAVEFRIGFPDGKEGAATKR